MKELSAVAAWLIDRVGILIPAIGSNRFFVSTRCRAVAELTLLVVALVLAWQEAQAAADMPARLRNIAPLDAVQLNRPSGIALSPNGRHVTAVITYGDWARNLTICELRLFDMEGAADQIGEVLLRRESDGNEAPLAFATWLNDRELSYAANDARGVRQVFTFDLATRIETQITHQPRSIRVFALSADQNRVIFTADRPADSARLQRLSDEGYAVPTSTDALEMWRPAMRQASDEADLFVLDRARRETKLICPLDNHPLFGRHVPYKQQLSSLSISPDGRFAVVSHYFPRLTAIPEQWKQYGSNLVKILLRRGHIPYTYGLVDLTSGRIEVLIDAPMSGDSQDGANFAWAPDSRSLAIANSHIPRLPQAGAIDQNLDEQGAVLEVELPGRRWRVVSPGKGAIIGWKGPRSVGITKNGAGAIYGKDGQGNWMLQTEIPAADAGEGRHTFFEAATRPERSVAIMEDPRTPPDLYVLSNSSSRPKRISRLNAAVESLQRGAMERVDIPMPARSPQLAYVVRPIGFREGQRYPAVIMHMDVPASVGSGYFTIDDRDLRAAYPVQPLAAAGFVVLMLYPDPARAAVVGTPAELRESTTSFEVAAQYLIGRKLVDRNRIAILGFSRACWQTLGALEMSQFPFAAGVALDSGIYQYGTYTLVTFGVPEWERMFGGSPLGETFANWKNNAVDLNVEKISVPLLMQAHGGTNGLPTLAHFQIYALLQRLGRPVEFVTYPGGIHILQRPREQLSSMIRIIDWLRFWLKDEADPDSAKREQYERWQRLKHYRTEATGSVSEGQ